MSHIASNCEDSSLSHHSSKSPLEKRKIQGQHVTNFTLRAEYSTSQNRRTFFLSSFIIGEMKRCPFVVDYEKKRLITNHTFSVKTKSWTWPTCESLWISPFFSHLFSLKETSLCTATTKMITSIVWRWLIVFLLNKLMPGRK